MIHQQIGHFKDLGYGLEGQIVGDWSGSLLKKQAKRLRNLDEIVLWRR